jgi:hypothetical protein
VPKKIGRNQPEEMPAILLARMGVDSRHQGRRLGAAAGQLENRSHLTARSA